MGNNKNILVIGRHQFIMDRVIAMLRQHKYNASGVSTDSEAILLLQTEPFDALVIGGGVELSSAELLKSEALKVNETMKIIPAHPETLLNDIEAAFHK